MVNKVFIYVKRVSYDSILGYVFFQDNVDKDSDNFYVKEYRDSSDTLASVKVLYDFIGDNTDKYCGTVIQYVSNKDVKMISARKSNSVEIQESRDKLRVLQKKENIELVQIKKSKEKEWYNRIRTDIMDISRYSENDRGLCPHVLRVGKNNLSKAKDLGIVTHKNVKGKLEYICKYSDREEYSFLEGEDFIESTDRYRGRVRGITSLDRLDRKDKLEESKDVEEKREKVVEKKNKVEENQVIVDRIIRNRVITRKSRNIKGR